jgi:hypothetical protein
MPSILKLALCLFSLTLIVPAICWGNSGSWRVALIAWKQFAVYMGALYLIGILTWLGMGAPH